MDINVESRAGRNFARLVIFPSCRSILSHDTNFPLLSVFLLRLDQHDVYYLYVACFPLCLRLCLSLKALAYSAVQLFQTVSLHCRRYFAVFLTLVSLMRWSAGSGNMRSCANSKALGVRSGNCSSSPSICCLDSRRRLTEHLALSILLQIQLKFLCLKLVSRCIPLLYLLYPESRFMKDFSCVNWTRDSFPSAALGVVHKSRNPRADSNCLPPIMFDEKLV